MTIFHVKVGPQCAQPEALAHRFLLTTKDEELCPLPSVSTFDIRNVTTSSVLIAWDSQDNNMTGLKGFLVAYHRLDVNDVVKKFKVNPSTRMFRLNTLMDNSVYLVCVVTQGSSYTDYSLYSEFAEAIRLEEEGEGDEQLPHSDQHVLGQGVAGFQEQQEIPSSNDTRYLITKPIVLNLDSKSSRCNKIKTPLDPSKLRMIDNKQLSAIIGCSAGLMVFFCIIISIIVAKPKRSEEEDIIVPKSDSLTDSYKSPSPKSRSASIGRDPKSLTNSAGSSLNRLNGLAEGVSETEWSAPTSGTLKKKRGPKVNSSPQRGQSSLAAQSSTESGPSHSSQRMSRHSSSELSVREGGRRGGAGGSSEQLSNGHRGGATATHHRAEMQRRSLTVDAAAASEHHHHQQQGQHTLPRGGQQARARHELGRSGTLPPPPQRFGYEMMNGQNGAEDCIPMIEYPDNSAHSSPQTLRVPRPASQAGGGRGRGGRVRQRGRGRGGGPPPPPNPPNQSQSEQEQVAYYPQEGGARNGYIKYNSVNAARY